MSKSSSSDYIASIDRAKNGLCDGDCDKNYGSHYGETLAVHVFYEKKDWGWFSYCENARNTDESNGFIVEVAA